MTAKLVHPVVVASKVRRLIVTLPMGATVTVEPTADGADVIHDQKRYIVPLPDLLNACSASDVSRVLAVVSRHESDQW